MSHTVAIMQPYLFPYLGYLQLMQSVDEFVLFDTAQFIRRGWIHRNRIVLNGTAHTFTVPVKKCARETPIHDALWSADPLVRTKLMQTIKQAYKDAPYVDAVLPWVERTLCSTESSVAKLIERHFIELYQYLGLEVNFYLASSRRWTDASGASQRILSMCQDLNATCYINPINGRHLYASEDFAMRGIELQFLEMEAVEYPQMGLEFVSHLSMIDVLMMNAPSVVLNLLQKYQLFKPT